MADLFGKVLNKIYGMIDKSITLTEKDLHPTDHFLLLGKNTSESCTITFKRTNSGLIMLLFDNDEPILLENCPESFYKTLLKNL